LPWLCPMRGKIPGAPAVLGRLVYDNLTGLRSILPLVGYVRMTQPTDSRTDNCQAA